MIDNFGRKIDYLRISLTDRCNLRCIYCMPEEGIEHVDQNNIMSLDHILKICKAMSNLGVRKVKLTGGEPLVRADLSEIIKQIKTTTEIQNITLTTNGVLLSKYIDQLDKAGLDAINISLDTLDKSVYQHLTRFDMLDNVLKGVELACNSGIKSVKINCVPMAGFNEKNLISIANLAKDQEIHVRFIELMPIGYGKQFKPIDTKDVMNIIQTGLGELVPYNRTLGNGPATYYHIDGFKGKIGFISAVSNIFCDTCNRIRLTSSGFLKTCLHYNKGIDLAPLINSGCSINELEKEIEKAVLGKPLKHSFNALDNQDNIDDKNMVSIGG